jgi:hypothetical protein
MKKRRNEGTKKRYDERQDRERARLKRLRTYWQEAMEAQNSQSGLGILPSFKNGNVSKRKVFLEHKS